MIAFDAALILAMLMLGTPPARPHDAASDRCGAPTFPEGFDCCLHHAVRSNRAPTPISFPPSAQIQTDGERTMQDVTQR
jgi:hypothetical protein